MPARLFQRPAALAIVVLGFLAPWLAGELASSSSEPPVRLTERPVRTVVLLPQLDRADEVELNLELMEPTEAAVEVVERVEPAPAPAAAEPAIAEAGMMVDFEDRATAPRGLTLRVGRDGSGDGDDDGAGAIDMRRKQRQTARSRATSSCLPDREDIARISDTAFRIEDSLVYYYANHPVEAEELAATWWSTDDDDAVQGFRLGRMRCGSLLRQAGLENGDVISTVNGMEIRTYTDGVMAFLKLRTKRVLWIGVIRKGEPVRLDYVLVDDGQARVELDADDPLADPSALVDRELELAELPWLQRKLGQRKLRRETRH